MEDFESMEVQVMACKEENRLDGEPSCERNSDSIRNFLQNLVVDTWIGTPLMNSISTSDHPTHFTKVASQLLHSRQYQKGMVSLTPNLSDNQMHEDEMEVVGLSYDKYA